MIVTQETISKLPLDEQELTAALLIDLTNLNRLGGMNLHLEWQDYHNEYSAERTDPCPDFYGGYGLFNENGEIMGWEPVSLRTLDEIMCMINDILYEVESIKHSNKDNH